MNSKNPKLTTDAVIDVNINSHDTNKKLDIKKRSIDEIVDNDIPLDQVTVSQLTRQVDDLVNNYNKLAKTLNRPQLEENNSKDTSQNVVS